MKYKLLIVITVIAAILRFYKLESFPVSLYWDEVANGYNAFSIAKNQTDEYGTKLPILFKSFNDYKLPGYIYLDAPFIKFLGLSEFSVRFPSALFGVFAVIGIYFLSKNLFANYKLSEQVALSASALLAISPWHLQFSRAAFEANVALTLVVLGSNMLFYGTGNRLVALFSIPVLATSIFFYHSPKLFVPLIVLVFFIVFNKLIFKNVRYYLSGLAISILFLTPLIIQTFRPVGVKHISEISIFSDKSLTVDYVDAKAKNPSVFANFFLNRRIPYIFTAANNYFSHFSFPFLFFGGDSNPRHHSAYHGNFYLFELPLIFIGFWILMKKVELKSKIFIAAWLVFSPLPAAFSQQSPHALRSLLMLPSLIMLSALGLQAVLVKRQIYKILAVIAIILFFTNYIYSYYFVYPLKDSASWAYGYKQMFSQIAEIENSYDSVIVTGRYWKPYIFYLFYNKIEPQNYFGFNQERIGKYKFGTTYWDSGGKDLDEAAIDSISGTKTLLAISPQELQAIGREKRFIKLYTVSDYSQKKEIFLIGEWQ